MTPPGKMLFCAVQQVGDRAGVFASGGVWVIAEDKNWNHTHSKKCATKTKINNKKVENN